MRLQLITLCLLVIFSAACKTQRTKKTKIEVGPSTAVQKENSAADALSDTGRPVDPGLFEATETSFETAKLKTHIEIRSGWLNQSFPANISIKKDSVIWMSVVIGLEAARALIDQDSVFLMDRLNRKYYKFSFADLSRQLNFDLNYGLIQALILGNMPVKPDTNDMYKEEPGYHSILQKRSSVEIDNRIDMTNNRLFALVARDEKTNSRMTVRYQDFVVVSEKIMPQLISVLVSGGESEPSDTTITFQHSRFDFSTVDIKFPFSIPKSFTEGKVNF